MARKTESYILYVLIGIALVIFLFSAEMNPVRFLAIIFIAGVLSYGAYLIGRNG